MGSSYYEIGMHTFSSFRPTSKSEGLTFTFALSLWLMKFFDLDQIGHYDGYASDGDAHDGG